MFKKWKEKSEEARIKEIKKAKCDELHKRIESIESYLGHGDFLFRGDLSVEELEIFEKFLDRLETYEIKENFVLEYLEGEISKFKKQEWIIMSSISTFDEGARTHVSFPEKVSPFSELGRQSLPANMVIEIEVKPWGSDKAGTPHRVSSSWKTDGLVSSRNRSSGKALEITPEERKLFLDYFIEDDVIIPWHREPSLINSIVGLDTIILKTCNKGIDAKFLCLPEMTVNVVDRLNEEFGIYKNQKWIRDEKDDEE